MDLLSANDTKLMQQCHEYYKAGHTELSVSEVADILGRDASEQAEIGRASWRERV